MLETLCTFLHSVRGRSPAGRASRSAAAVPPVPQGLHDGSRGSWGTGGRVDELPDTAGAQPDGGSELPERVPGLLGGDQGLAVDLVCLGGLLRRLLHAGE
jgi:hypothetical protein